MTPKQSDENTTELQTLIVVLSYLHLKQSSTFHIAIEGCVGIGKTTLARKLARVRKADLLLEAFKKHPFLPEFYANPAENAFETEMHFLLLHYHQLKTIPKRPDRETITDFTFVKDKLFADITLKSPAELAKFNDLYRFLLKRVPQPDLLIYLRGPDDLIMQRVRKRNRSIEKPAEEKYFKQLRRHFDRFFLSRRPRVMVIDVNKVDCIENPNAVSDLSNRIDAIFVNKSANNR